MAGGVRLLEQGASAVFITRGSRSAIYVDAGRRLEVCPASDQTQQAERGEGEGGGFGDGGGDFQVVKRCEFIMGLHAYYSKGRTLEPDGITPPPQQRPQGPHPKSKSLAAF